MSQKSTYEDNVISLRDVKIVQKNFTVLSNVNLTIEKGKFNYLIGKTGSGKSSLLKFFMDIFRFVREKERW